MTETAPKPKAGDEFTHPRMLDPWWKPGPGQRYVDAPHAEMTVTRVTSVWVYFTYTHGNTGKGAYKVDRATYDREQYATFTDDRTPA